MNHTYITPERDFIEKHIGYRWYAIIMVYYLALSVWFISYYRHETDADGISYISLAQKYLNGDFANAVNGYWSPMISWFIAPFMSLGLEPIIAFRTVSILFGIMTLVGIDKLMTEVMISRFTRVVYLMALSPVVAWYAENDVGADLLGACVLLYYIHATLRDDYQNKKFAGITCGILGALSYLAKNYNFYFFLLHFTCINAWYWKQAAGRFQKRTIIFNFVSAIAAFAVISGVWIGFLSVKYDTLSVSTAGGYNLSLIRPDSTDHPVLTYGLIPPPNNTAVSAWEDPSYINVVHWNPFKTFTDFIFFLEHITKNIYKYLSGFATNYIFDLTVAFLVVFPIFSKKTVNRKISYIVLTILLYPIGYFALYYDGQRHVLINSILLYVLSAYALNSLFLEYGRNIVLKASISAILCVSLIALTIVRIKRDKSHLDVLNDIYHVSTKIEKYYNMNGVNIASQDGHWNPTNDLAYFLKARYFGKVAENVTDEQLLHDLIHYKITYYLVFGSLKNHIDILIPEREFETLIGNMTVYQVVQHH